MKTLNRVDLLGRLGQDPDFRITQSGTAIANLSIATNEGYKDQSGEWQEKTEWHRVTLWKNLAEVADKYLSKGSAVMISGKLQTRSYEDKNGETKYITEVVGNNIIMLDAKGDKLVSESNTPQTAKNIAKELQSPTQGKYEDPPEDDVPF